MNRPPIHDGLKNSVARTLKWNVVDRVSSQVLYAVTGIVLAKLLTDEEFGLVGAILVFQAYASLLIDSGFASALLQSKAPTRTDYSTVLWFNLGLSVIIYVILFFLAPWIATLFQGNQELIPLSRVMFLTFIINSLSIVQINRLTKRMDTRMVAVSNSVGLIAGAVTGIWLALAGYGAWALVWQAITISVVKTSLLWFTSHWRPAWVFSWHTIRRLGSVGAGVMVTSLLNTVFQTIGSFLIGHKVSLGSLGYYTQADKWSKMGVTSLSQVFTSSFIPMLAGVQDDPERFSRLSGKTHRLASYLLFPAMCLLAVMATPVFHTLFGTKWDPSIVMFQLLLLRGIPVVLSGLYSNFILALGRSRLLVVTEIVRDVASLAAILLTYPYLPLVSDVDMTLGLQIFVAGQLAASCLTWFVTLVIVSRITSRTILSYLGDIMPYLAITALSLLPAIALGSTALPPFAVCLLQFISFAAVYISVNALMRSRIQADLLAYILGNRRKL